MMVKALGQFLLATVFVNMLPADAAWLEWQAGVGSEAAAYLTTAEMRAFATPAEAMDTASYPTKADPDSMGVLTTAESVLVEDADSGMWLLAKHPHDVRSMGSVTKLMTALVFLETGPDLSAYVTLDPTIDLVRGGRIYLAFYDPLTLEHVLAASLVGSDNTATESLMRFSGFTREEFLARMNEKAEEIGMEDATFTDPTGIDAGNMATAKDLVQLLKAAEESEVIADYMQLPQTTVYHQSGRAITIENTNKVLNSFLNEDPYAVTGGKTGYLPQAGYVLATTIDREGDTIHVVVMGSDTVETRVQEVKGLAAWAYKTFKWPSQN